MGSRKGRRLIYTEKLRFLDYIDWPRVSKFYSPGYTRWRRGVVVSALTMGPVSIWTGDDTSAGG